MMKKTYSKEQSLQKARQFCAYQERCHEEVAEKLDSFGLMKNQMDDLLSLLIEENYLNEERFAIQFAGGRFRMKHWGRVKIRYALKQRRVSQYCILKAIHSIDDDSYQATLEKLFHQKWASLRADKNIMSRRKKTRDYLLQKGYESDLVNDLVKSL